MSIKTESIPIQGVSMADVDARIETHRAIPNAHHEVVTLADVDGRVGDHNDLLSPHGKATSIGGRGFGLADGDLAVLPTAIEGQILKRGATAWEAGAAPAGGGNLVLMEDIEITTPVQSILLAGLSINIHKNYKLIIESQHAQGIWIEYFIYFNEDLVNGNYRSQRGRLNGTSISLMRESRPFIFMANDTDRTAFCIGYLSLTRDQAYFIGTTGTYGFADCVLYDVVVRHNISHPDITSVRISGGTVDSFGIGSKIRLYRL